MSPRSSESTQADSKTQGVKTGSGAAVLLGFALLAILFAGGGGWLYFANLTGAVIAQGTVAVKGKPKTVQHLDGGLLQKFMSRMVTT